MPFPERGRSATSSANMSSNSRNVKLPFMTTRFHYWGVDLPVDLPIWSLTVEMWNHHSWPLDATTGGPIWALTVEMWNCHSWPLDATTGGPIWALTVEMWNCHSWPLDATTRGSRSASWSANMSSNSRNVKSPFLTTRCHYWVGRSASRSATSSANMSSNSTNVKLPYLTTRCHYLGVDLPA